MLFSVHKRSDEKLIEAFNSCMDAFTNLRSNHINIAAKWVSKKQCYESSAAIIYWSACILLLL